MVWTVQGNIKGPKGDTGDTGATGDTGSPGTTTWAGITDKPTYIGAGTSQALARSAIGAGTGNSNLAVGTASTDAKAGDYQPASTNISDATTVGKAVLVATNAGAARTAIGAGTSSLAIGTAGGTACEGNDSRLPAGADIVDADISGSAAIALSKLATGRVSGLNNATPTSLTMCVMTAAQYTAAVKDAATVYFVTA